MSFEMIEILKKDIDEQAQLEIDQINFEMKMIHDDEIDSFKHQLIRETELHLSKEMNRLILEETSLKTRMDLEIKNRIIAYRNGLVQTIRKELEQKLQHFVASPAYQEFLVKKLNNITEGKIFCREEDKEFLQSKTNLPIEIRKFQFGGLINLTENVEYDYSLDTAFKEQMNYFIAHSKFVV